MLDFVTGPVAKNTFGTDANAKLGNPNAEQAVWTLFKTPRPLGLGMRCASLDVDSYVQRDGHVEAADRLAARPERAARARERRPRPARRSRSRAQLMESGSRSTAPPRPDRRPLPRPSCTAGSGSSC